MRNLSKILEDALNFNAEWVFQNYKSHCLKKLSSFKGNNNKTIFEHEDIELIKKMFKVDTIKTLDFALNIIKGYYTKSSGEDKYNFYFEIEYQSRTHGHSAIYYLLVDRVKEQAKKITPWFNQFFEDHQNSKSNTILKVLFMGLGANPAHYSDNIFQLVSWFHKDRGLVGNCKLEFHLRQLLAVSYSHFNQVQKETIDKIVLSIQPKHEIRIFTDVNGKKKHSLGRYGHHQFLYLSALPLSEVMARPKLRKRFQELKRKFKTIKDEVPPKLQIIGVGPPLDKVAYSKMTFDQWEQSFHKYNREFRAEIAPSKGSLLEHSRAFQNEVKNRPSHFFHFIEKLIDENAVPYEYIVAGLTGLKDAKYNALEVQRIYKKALPISFDRDYTLYFVWVTSYFIEAQILDQDILEYLIDKATNHPDPQGNSIINSSFALVIFDRFSFDCPHYFSDFRK